jgi:hypothetical protein
MHIKLNVFKYKTYSKRKNYVLTLGLFLPRVLLFYSVYVLHLFGRWTNWDTGIAQLELLLYIFDSVGKTLCSLVSSS